MNRRDFLFSIPLTLFAKPKRDFLQEVNARFINWNDYLVSYETPFTFPKRKVGQIYTVGWLENTSGEQNAAVFRSSVYQIKSYKHVDIEFTDYRTGNVFVIKDQDQCDCKILADNVGLAGLTLPFLSIMEFFDRSILLFDS